MGELSKNMQLNILYFVQALKDIPYDTWEKLNDRSCIYHVYKFIFLLKASRKKSESPLLILGVYPDSRNIYNFFAQIMTLFFHLKPLCHVTSIKNPKCTKCNHSGLSHYKAGNIILIVHISYGTYNTSFSIHIITYAV